MIASWPCPDSGEEFALVFDHARKSRLLILPALFDEANKTRQLLVQVMRRLDAAGIDCLLPDLPGCNESLAPLEAQSLTSWKAAAMAATQHFCATHVLTMRASAILAPPMLAGWRYAPVGGTNTLRGMLRARTISSHEAGLEETPAKLLEQGRKHGLELAGYTLGPAMISELEKTALTDGTNQHDVTHATVSGGAPWLRAEPDFDAAQADALAAIITMGLTQ